MPIAKREVLARFLGQSGLRSLLATLFPWSGVLCLNYHRIGDPRASDFSPELWNATADDFDAQIRFLKSRCDIIGPDDLHDVQTRGQGRYLILTFDDGYADN